MTVKNYNFRPRLRRRLTSYGLHKNKKYEVAIDNLINNFTVLSSRTFLITNRNLLAIFTYVWSSIASLRFESRNMNSLHIRSFFPPLHRRIAGSIRNTHSAMSLKNGGGVVQAALAGMRHLTWDNFRFKARHIISSSRWVQAWLELQCKRCCECVGFAASSA
jgi:hypothetical protein